MADFVNQFFEQNTGGYEGTGTPATDILNATMGISPEEQEEQRRLQANQTPGPRQGPDLQNNGQKPPKANKKVDNPIGQAMEDATVGVRDWIDNTFQGDKLTPEQIRNNRQKARQYAEAADKDQKDAVPEAVRVVKGGVGKAIESIGEFAELVSDTKASLTTPIYNEIYPELVGPLNPKDDVFSDKYEAARWDLGSSGYAQTPVGKVAEGFLSFGLTLWATGGLKGDSGILGAVKAVKSGQGAVGAAKAFGTSGAVRGALADLIQRPEEGNLSNLIKDNAPEWYPTWLTALAVEEGENPWLSRLKTAFEGMGLSEVADIAVAAVRGKAAGARALKQTGNLEAAVDSAAEAMTDSMASAPARAPKWGDVASTQANQGYFTVGPRQVDNLDPVFPAVESLQKGEIPGFTVDPVTGAPARGGYAVAIDASSELTDLSPESINKWLTDNASALSREDTYLGGWLDETTGKPVIEVSRIVPDLEEARRLGKEFDQIGIFDVSGNKFIPTGGQDLLKKTRNIGFSDLNAAPIRDSMEVDPQRLVKAHVDDGAILNEAGQVSSQTRRPDVIKVGDVDTAAAQQTVARNTEALGFKGRGDGILTEAGYQKIGASPDGEKYIQQVIKSDPDLQAIADRSGRSMKEITEEAYDLVADFNGDVSRLPGFNDMDGTKILSDPAVVAAKTLINNIADDIADSAYALASAAASDMAIVPNIERLTNQLKSLLRAHKYTSYHYGSGLATFKIPALGIEMRNPFKAASSADVAAAIKKSDETLDHLVSMAKSGDSEQMQKAVELANAIVLSGGDPSTLKTLANWAGDITGRDLMSLMYNSMLSGPATHVVNTVSNMVNTVYRPMSAILGSYFTEDGYIQRKAAAASFSHMYETLRESFSVAGTVLRTGGNAINDGSKGLIRASEANLKIDMLRKAAERSDDLGFKFGVGVMDMLHSFANNPLLDFPSRFLTTSDEFFKTMVGRMEWRAQSMAEAIKAADGTDKQVDVLFQEILKKNADAMFEMSGPTKGAIKDSKLLASATDVTFQTELDGAARAFAGMVNGIPAMRVFFPFVKTGHNILAYAYSHLPVIGSWLPEFQKAMKSGDPYQIAVMKGRQAFGSMLIGAAGFAAMTDNLTGNGPSDPGERKEWLANNRPRSFRIPGTETWVDYSRIEPFNMILSAVADVAYGLKANELREADAEYLMGHLMYTVSANLTQRSYFAGLVPLGQLLTPGYQGLKQLQTIPANTLNNFLPYSGARRTLANAMSPYMREFTDELERVKFQMSAGFVKGASSVRYDWLSGEPIYAPSGGVNAVWPYKVQQRGQDMVRDELEDIGYEAANITKRRGVELSPEMISKIQRQMGTSTLHKELKQLFSGKGYQAMKEDAIAQRQTGSLAPKRSFAYHKEIDKIVDRHLDAAVNNLYHSDNDFRYAYDKRNAERVRAGMKPQNLDSNHLNLEALLNF